MLNKVKSTWNNVIMPLVRRPKRVQVAALCYQTKGNAKQVLLITSCDTGRWIVPKGWPMDGFDGPGAALQEAWEEAGVAKADIDPTPVGQYEYEKGMGEGMSVQVETQVYLTQVHDLKEEYPDAGTRKREWFAPAEAANLVDEPGLKKILAAL